MTLLTPIPALVAAAIAVPALLALYFLKLRRRPVRVSSTLLWVQATRDLQVNVPFRWLRTTWLLLLQLLILGLFLLAMARPVLNLPGRAPSRTILLVDRSASMSAHDMPRGASRLVLAQDRAVGLLSDPNGARWAGSVAVVAFAAEPEIIANFSGDRGAAQKAIRAITPTDQPADLPAALRLCSAMLAGDTDETRALDPGLVILLSDGSFAGAAENEGFALAGAQFRFERIGPPPGPAGSDNLGIVALAARRDRDDPGTVRVFIRVQNASARQVAAPLVLSVDGREADRRPLVIPGAVTGGVSGAGQAAATFSLRSREGGLIQARIDRADILDADNTAAVVLDPPTKPRIVVVVPADERARTSWVVTNILDELELPYRRVPAPAWEGDDAAGRTDLIIFHGVEPRTLPAVPTLSLGAGLPIAGLSALQPAQRAGYFISWRRTHPVLRDLTLDGVYVAAARALPESASIAGSAPPVELARGANGPLMLALEQGPRIIVAFDPADSNWPLSAGFPIFLAGAIDFLTTRADASTGRMFTTIGPAEIAAPETGPMILDGPARIRLDLARRAPESRLTSLGRLERAGVYRIESGSAPTAPPSARMIAVNLLDETETGAAVRDSIRIAGDAVPAGGRGEGAGPRELWPWLILVALGLLTVEWFLNAWLMRA